MEPVNLLKTLLEEIQKISSQVKELSQAPKPKDRPNRSSECDKLFEALSKAQSEMLIADRDSNNPYFKSKYADLASITRASRPYLTKHGLCVCHQVEQTEEGQNILVCILGHSSGQYLESRFRILPQKPDIQSLGSHITYLRRYSMVSLLGIADADDDGEMAMVEFREKTSKGTALNTKYNPKEESYETISKDQINELEYILAEFPDLTEQVLSGLHLQSLADMPKSKFRASIERIREIKLARSGLGKHNPSQIAEE
jgi:hypothetical protein